MWLLRSGFSQENQRTNGAVPVANSSCLLASRPLGPRIWDLPSSCLVSLIVYVITIWRTFRRLTGSLYFNFMVRALKVTRLRMKISESLVVHYSRENSILTLYIFLSHVGSMVCCFHCLTTGSGFLDFLASLLLTPETALGVDFTGIIIT